MKIISRFTVFSATAFAAVVLASTGPALAQATDQKAPATPARNGGSKGRVSESVRPGTVLAPDGQIAVTSIDRKWDGKSGTGTLNEAAVTPDGKLSTREANLTRNPDGTTSARGTFTDFDGRSYNFTETTKHTAAGSVIVGRMVDEDGKVSNYETTSASSGRGQTRRTMVITHPDGTRETRVEMLAPARGSLSS